MNDTKKARYHLPGLFEFYELYKKFLPLFYEHNEWFYDWCEIGSIYGAPADCLWGGGRVGFGENRQGEVFALMREYGISARLTFSNSLLREEHLSDSYCVKLCESLSRNGQKEDGIIVYSDLLLNHLKEKYPDFVFTSSTTKVITDFDDFVTELKREDFNYVVPDFRLNPMVNQWDVLDQNLRGKVELLCNECCNFECRERKECYEYVSAIALGETSGTHICKSFGASEGYVFSKAMENPGFIGTDLLTSFFVPRGYTNFKIEGRSLGSAMVLEFLLYYLTRPEYHLRVREKIYLDSSLDLF